MTWTCRHCGAAFPGYFDLYNHRVTDHPELDPLTDEETE